ncbi:MAG: hypothetical protein WDN45_14765 [Caulobacteraceae bacterium]
MWSITGYNTACVFEVRKPLRDWPDCAVGLEFRRGQMFLVSGHQRLFAQTPALRRQEEGAPILVQGHCRPRSWLTPARPSPRIPTTPSTAGPTTPSRRGPRATSPAA